MNDMTLRASRNEYDLHIIPPPRKYAIFSHTNSTYYTTSPSVSFFPSIFHRPCSTINLIASDHPSLLKTHPNYLLSFSIPSYSLPKLRLRNTFIPFFSLLNLI